MAGLLDIATATKMVAVRGHDIEVFGVSIKGIAYLLGRFPELRKLMSGLEVDVDSLLKMGGDVVAAAIAAGCGHAGDKKWEEKAEQLVVGEQADLISAIIELTIPNGIGPLIEKFSAMSGHLDLTEPPQKIRDMKLQKLSKA